MSQTSAAPGAIPVPTVEPAEPGREPDRGPEPWPPPWTATPVTATPAPTPVRAAEPDGWEAPATRRRRWRPGCFSVLLAVVLALVGGGLYVYRTGLVTPRQILDAAGFGAAEVQVVNLRDDAIRVHLTAGSQEDGVPAAFRLAPFEVRVHRAVRPTVLRATLVAPGGTAIGSCRLDLRAGDRVQLVALPDLAIVRHSELAPATGRDLVVDGSRACT